MRSAPWKAFLVVLALSLLGATMPAASPAPSIGAAENEYSTREARARGLEDFEGGFHGVVIFAFVVFVVASIALCVWVDPHWYCHEHGVYHSHRHVHPKVEDSPRPPER